MQIKVLLMLLKEVAANAKFDRCNNTVDWGSSPSEEEAKAATKTGDGDAIIRFLLSH